MINGSLFFFFEDPLFQHGDTVISAGGEPEALNVRAANLIYILWFGLAHYQQRE